MEQRQLAKTGVTVSALGLGTRRLGGADGDAGTMAERIRLVHRAIDGGINLIATSTAARHGDAPELLARALDPERREQVALAVTIHDPPPGGSGEQIAAAVEEAMRRLDSDWIDLVLLHRSWIGDIDGALAALSELVRSEEIGMIGTSEAPVSTLVEAQWVAQERFFKRFVVAEVPCSILDRECEHEVLPTCRRYGVSALASRPLGAGWLWGDVRRGADPLPVRFDLARVENQRRLRRAEGLSALAAEAGLPLAQMALAFALRRPAVASAIVGPRSIEQLEDLLPAAEVELDDALLAAIDQIAPDPA